MKSYKLTKNCYLEDRGQKCHSNVLELILSKKYVNLVAIKSMLIHLNQKNLFQNWPIRHKLRANVWRLYAVLKKKFY